jgi:glycine/D-amino acid oxidase-like deaminating enzyme/nitrite reductase/ring-hydroxylating ferredoxin subunit
MGGAMMETKTAWQNVRIPHFTRLNKYARFDVVVVGGGITGLTAAYLLTKAGKTVALLERDRLGTGDTGRTTAHLTYVTDLRPGRLANIFGRADARLVWRGGEAAIDTIEAISKAEAIDCDFHRIPGFLHAALRGTADEHDDLQADCDTANELGFTASFENSVAGVEKPGVCFANQAKFHPLKYLRGLAKAADDSGCAIFEESEVAEVDAHQTVKVNDRRVEFDYLVIATHVPMMGKAGLIGATLFQTKLAPYSTYALGATVPAGTLPEASFWDTADPYHYLRVDRHDDFDYVIFGGEDHKTGQSADTAERFVRLEQLLKELLPAAQVDCRWSGQVVETNDGLPYIGETAPGQFAATGFSGNGMTFGTLAAMMACDAVLGRDNAWRKLFDVNRKKIRGGALDFVKENLDYPYYLVRDRLGGAEATSTRAVKRGEGKLLKIDGKYVACFRDDKGKVSTVSAVCTHLGCLVHWNEAERTWDCPCHGSRFQPTGDVVAGPAESPLEKTPPPKRRKESPRGKSRERSRGHAAVAKNEQSTARS